MLWEVQFFERVVVVTGATAVAMRSTLYGAAYTFCARLGTEGVGRPIQRSQFSVRTAKVVGTRIFRNGSQVSDLQFLGKF